MSQHYRLTVDGHDRGLVTLPAFLADPLVRHFPAKDLVPLTEALQRDGSAGATIFRAGRSSINIALRTAIPPAETPTTPRPRSKQRCSRDLVRYLIDRTGDAEAAVTLDDLGRAGFAPWEIERHLRRAGAIARRAVRFGERHHRAKAPVFAPSYAGVTL